MRLYLDTNFFIRFVEGPPVGLGRIIEGAMTGAFGLVTSELTLAETLVVPLREGRDDLAQIYEDLLAPEGLIAVVPVTRTILRRSAAVRAEIGDRGRDAIHVATAAVQSCDHFVSSDRAIHVPPPISVITLESVISGAALS